MKYTNHSVYIKWKKFILIAYIQGLFLPGFGLKDLVCITRSLPRGSCRAFVHCWTHSYKAQYRNSISWFWAGLSGQNSWILTYKTHYKSQFVSDPLTKPTRQQLGREGTRRPSTHAARERPAVVVQKQPSAVVVSGLSERVWAALVPIFIHPPLVKSPSSPPAVRTSRSLQAHPHARTHVHAVGVVVRPSPSVCVRSSRSSSSQRARTDFATPASLFAASYLFSSISIPHHLQSI